MNKTMRSVDELVSGSIPFLSEDSVGFWCTGHPHIFLGVFLEQLELDGTGEDNLLPQAMFCL